MFLFNLCLKALRLGAERISSGSSFQSRIAVIAVTNWGGKRVLLDPNPGPELLQ